MNNRLKELRKRKKLSQKAFAMAFNDYLKETESKNMSENEIENSFISYATISRWENGQTPIPNYYIKKLADYFEVTVQYIQGLTYSEEQILNIINQVYIDKYDDFKKKGDYAIDPFSQTPYDDKLYIAMKNYLNYHYIEVEFSKEELEKFDNAIKNFWKKCFEFVFDNPLIKVEMKYGGNKRGLIRNLSHAIYKKYLNDSQSIISRVFDETTNKEIKKFESNKDELLRFGTKKEIVNEIDELITKLNNFKQILYALPDNHEKPNSNKYNI